MGFILMFPVETAIWWVYPIFGQENHPFPRFDPQNFYLRRLLHPALRCFLGAPGRSDDVSLAISGVSTVLSIWGANHVSNIKYKYKYKYEYKYKHVVNIYILCKYTYVRMCVCVH